ncbi:MAG: UbiA family prenyltransferase [Deltaproteobacteria bacterium]|nr:UbiA family prenyltransferase [Deltaproteobacteria bacterium]MBW1962186.1 UbiA family prenyltransferase [Deltaproteobacteria bacterium]MBW2151515.1 UbiA family prenyltransferase [Deltaproteobacteria bacterium]
MNDTSTLNRSSGIARIKLFLGLSRTPHGLLDMATAALGALLWLGAFPPWNVVLIGLITAFAGYTAVYALNDLVDYRVDKERVRFGKLRASAGYLDDVLIRHPIAHGLLSFKAGLYWTVSWALLALAGAYILNPVCVVIFLSGCLLETVYCLLLRVSYLRTFVSGAVKTSGAVAAVFAVDPKPSFVFVTLLFLWLFFWEVGGQNIPHDWADIEEDRQLGTETIAVRLGADKSAKIIFFSLVLAVGCGILIFSLSPVPYKLSFMMSAAAIGILLLMMPAVRVLKTNDRKHAMELFNRASYYPLALLGVVIFVLVIT